MRKGKEEERGRERERERKCKNENTKDERTKGGNDAKSGDSLVMFIFEWSADDMASPSRAARLELLPLKCHSYNGYNVKKRLKRVITRYFYLIHVQPSEYVKNVKT